VLTDALVEHGLPRHEAEAEAAIATDARDHREPAAGQLGGSNELPADGVTGNGGPPWQPAFGCERIAGSFEIDRLKPLDQILGRSDIAGANVGDTAHSPAPACVCPVPPSPLGRTFAGERHALTGVSIGSQI
jgi:hypothetical protein